MPSETPDPSAAADHSARLSRRERVRDSVRFVGALVRNPGAVGAILPSSRFLAHRMVQDMELASGDLVLEYGPGTGPMTAALRHLDLASRGVHYLGIELDPRLHLALSRRFAGMDFHCGSVVDVEQILAERGLPQARYIISGLPFASLPEEVQRGAVQGSHAALVEGGEFRTFQYVHAYRLPAARRFRKMMEETFTGFSRSTPVLRNVPPAYVLTYRR